MKSSKRKKAGRIATKVMTAVASEQIERERSWQRKQSQFKSHQWREELQDGGRVRRGDHLPPHRYIRNTSTCGTAPTEHLLNAGRRPQTSQKARNSPRTWVGQK